MGEADAPGIFHPVAEVPVHHYHRAYGKSQFFNFRRLFRTAIDVFKLWFALVIRREHLKGKPAPDMFLAAAAAVGVPANEAAVFEDALAGVAAGRAGGFGFVVGVDRIGQADALRAHGADVVVSDLSELLEQS